MNSLPLVGFFVSNFECIAAIYLLDLSNSIHISGILFDIPENCVPAVLVYFILFIYKHLRFHGQF